MKLILISSFVFLSLFSPTAQSQLGGEHEEMRRLLGDDFFKRFEQMDKRFEQLLKEQMGQSAFFDPAESEWRETDSERVYVLKIKEANGPLDVQVKKGLITIKSSSNNPSNRALRSMMRSESVPYDVDPNSANIETKKGEIQIHFKKRKVLERTPLAPIPGAERI